MHYDEKTPLTDSFLVCHFYLEKFFIKAIIKSKARLLRQKEGTLFVLRIILRIVQLLFLLSSVFTSAQDPKESKKIDLINTAFKSDTLKALQLISNYQESSDVQMRHLSKLTAAYYYYKVKSDLPKARKIYIDAFEGALKDQKAFSKKNLEYIAIAAVGNVFYIEKALGDNREALSFIEKYKSYIPNELYTLFYNILRIEFGDYERGIEGIKEDFVSGYYKKYELKKNDIREKVILANRYVTIGEAYQKWYAKSKKLSLLDSADFYFRKTTLVMASSHFMPEYTNALYSMRTAKSYVLKGDYENALLWYKKRDQFPVIKEYPRTEQMFDLGMADCFLQLNESHTAIQYAIKYLKSYNHNPTSKENLLISYHILSTAYETLKKKDSAFHYAKKSIALTDELEKNHLIAKDFIHNYNINDVKYTSNKIIYKEHRRQKILVWIVAIVILLLIAASAYLLRIRKRNIQNHERFLKIISELKSQESKKNPETASGIIPQNKPQIDKNLAEQISNGLQKMEDKLYFLKPEFKLAFVAKKLNTNTAYLSQYFNQNKNQTFSEYVQKMRIEYVLRELKNNPKFRNYTIQAIAEEIGYKEASAFFKAFKKHTGITPSFYIQELTNEK